MQLEAQAARGKLKIFFGSSAGVGKTFAMLSAAHAMKAQGLDVVVGIVETHGRSETARMVEGLELLPRKAVDYRGRTLTEFDLDAAIARHPQLILVDELAHTNVEGSRHPKRWQDVEELLSSGIDVYTSLNVQHLESLNDVVGQITQIRVHETLPDFVFDRADEVTLVDLPAEELLQRLKEGKVYLSEQAERAAKHFFRKGNLIALRELALRRTADRVDAQMREYRADQSIHRVWQAKERLLVCVGPGNSERLVRAGARLAANLRADWIVVYVETPKLQKLPPSHRQQILDSLNLGRELGAETQSLAGADAASSLISYARSRNVSKVVLAPSSRSRVSQLLRAPISEKIASSPAGLDVYVIGTGMERDGTDTANASTQTDDESVEAAGVERRKGLLFGAMSSVLATGLAWPVWQHFDLTNVAMVYLLAVVYASARFGRWPGVLTSVLSVASFDFFFVPPRFSFAVSDTQFVFTFVVMLVVALTISSLTANIRFQARIAMHREQRAQSLYNLSRELAGALTYDQILEIGVRHVETEFACKAAILLPDSHEKVRQPVRDAHRDSWPVTDEGIGQWVYDHQQEAGLGTHTLTSAVSRYLPLKAPMRTRGVLVLEPQHPRFLVRPEQQQMLQTAASQIALAIERVHYVEVAQDALVSMESERLRNTLLQAVSHDLRTPLTVIVGLASTLRETLQLSAAQLGTVDAIHVEAMRMEGLISNLLEMARLQAGAVNLHREWQVLEEIVGSALRACGQTLATCRISVTLPSDLPLVEFDAILIERVLCNLLENAAKYAGKDAIIDIRARVIESDCVLTISDNGPGIPAGMERRIFEKFLRGEKESATSGVGLGLAICEAIMTAHKGRIWADNRAEGGAQFCMALPLGNPPDLAQLEGEFA
ncbi:DUF4118 domain-containing protein [Burkholderiaceae bacterium DAT-1]|nr:DUF4118 domain-containing protein [Burkholderiaceae bacterium DAT-1]